MDDDKFDKEAPENTPHAFESAKAVGYPALCDVCGRGSGHHVHETAHAFVVGKAGWSGPCVVCDRRGDDYTAHPVALRRIDPVAFVSARALRWVKGAPEPERHDFDSGHDDTPALHCFECGELAGNGNVHTDPPATPHVFIRRTVPLSQDPADATDCAVCGGQEDDGKAHRVPVDLYEPENELDDARTERTKQELAKTARRYRKERDDAREQLADVRRVTTPGGITYNLVSTASERHVFVPGSDEPGDYPYETCAVCGGQEDDGKAHVLPEPDQINQPAHYTAHPSGIECIQITEHMSFTLGNVVKYIWRADLKGDAVEDLEKAVWYLRRELDRRNGKTTKY